MTSNDNFFAYSEYKSTEVEWVNSIPSHWDSRPMFSSVKRQQIKNTGNKKSKVLSLSYGNIVRRNVETNFGLLPESFETYQIVKPGNIILRLTDLQNDKRSLRVGLVKEDGIITSAYICLQPLPGINNEYIYLLLHSYDIMKVFYSLGSGVRQSLTYDELKRLSLIVPPMEEQKAIVNFINQRIHRIDNLIEKKQRLIELLQEKRQALITNTVTKGMDPDVPMKDSGIPWLGEVPMHWEVVKLKHLKEGTLTYGANESADTDNPDLPRFIRITDIDQNGNLRPDTFKSLPYDIAKDYLLNDEDLLFARSGGTVGKVIMYKSEWGQACFAGYLIRFRANIKKVLPEFVWYFTQSQSYWSSINSDTIQATIQNFSAEKYGNIELVIPGIEEQKKISEYLNKVVTRYNILINKIQTQITKLQEYRQALISAAVTGKIDVREKISS